MLTFLLVIIGILLALVVGTAVLAAAVWIFYILMQIVLWIFDPDGR